jgi:hypothetical protein
LHLAAQAFGTRMMGLLEDLQRFLPQLAGGLQAALRRLPGYCQHDPHLL